MISGNKLGIRVGGAALSIAVMATSAHAVDTLKLGIGVRETATTEAIGANGGTVGAIEWVRGQDATALSLVADNSWQFFSFTFGTDPVTAVTGVSGDGTLSSANMKGVLEHIAIRNSTPTSSEINVFFDDLTLTVNSSQAGTPLGTYVLADWEAQAVGAEHMFQEPGFSGSTSGSLAATPNIARVVDNTVTEPHGGAQSYEANFRFTSPSTAAWARFTTFGFNPTIDFAAGNVLSFWAKATIAPPTMFWNVWTGGDWGTGSNWSNSPAEPIPGQPIAVGGDPNGGGDAARFLTPSTGTPQPQTVNLNGDRYLNQLLIDNEQAYTFSGGTLIMTSTSNPPRTGTATIATVNGSHNINPGEFFLNSSLNLSVAGAGNTLTIGTPIELLPPLVSPTPLYPHIIITKSGEGTASVGDVRYGYLVVSGGTMTVRPGSALDLVFTERAAALPVTAATSRQAIFIQPNGTLNLTNTSPTLLYRFIDTDINNGDQSGEFEATILNDGTLNMSGGTLSTTRITISSVRGDLNLSNGASVTANYVAQDVVTIADSTLTIRAQGGTGHLGGVSSIQGLSITGTGVLELNNNDLAIFEGASLAATVRGYIQSGRIHSNAAANDPQQRTTLGYATGAQLFGASNGTISGHGLTPNGLIVKYTWYGDATLDGIVNQDDFARIDRGFAMGLGDWVNGDFDNNGTVNQADYALIDRVFMQQSGVLSPEILSMRMAQFGPEYVSALIASVPEPVGLGMIGLVGAGLMARRRVRGAA